MPHLISFYGVKGINPNYHYTFYVNSENDARPSLARLTSGKNSISGVRAAWYIRKDKAGNVLKNLRLR